ncbi:MAG: ABC transporter substrate-binding protein [Pseudomonadota bacterium]|nr:ABC transporter substrate-binding protein [Pseudomonadota bacterium]
MRIRKQLLAAVLASLALCGCRQSASGPIVVSAVGDPPQLANPNLVPLDPPSALLAEAVAQGLVRFDGAGQIEPALAQSWIVSDDGLRYTFRLARTKWANGEPVTAEQVEARLRATLSRSSKNPLKPLLGAVADVEAMTESVLEIALRAPRPNLLQLLAQPEMAIIRRGQGTGPYRPEKQADGSILLSLPEEEDEEIETSPEQIIILRGEPAAMAVARFRNRMADLVTGGTAGELPIVRAAELPGGALRFDPAAGLFGLAFIQNSGPAADAEVRRALSMAVDRPALVAALGVPDLLPRESVLPSGIEELPDPSLPAWSADPLPMRREVAAGIISGMAREAPVRLRVAVPDAPGYKLVFAHLRRDWRLIGVRAEAVPLTADADLRLVDAVAAANLATWYLRRFSCDGSTVCSPEADRMLDGARSAQTGAERQARLAEADRLLVELTPFIPLTAPVRWSLVSPRLTGFQANPFARHFVGSLLAARR